jgi:uncharacterized coiled-coil DUF342 family protein
MISRPAPQMALYESNDELKGKINELHGKINELKNDKMELEESNQELVDMLHEKQLKYNYKVKLLKAKIMVRSLRIKELEKELQDARECNEPDADLQKQLDDAVLENKYKNMRIEKLEDENEAYVDQLLEAEELKKETNEELRRLSERIMKRSREE